MGLNSGVILEESLWHVDKALGLLREPTHRFVYNWWRGTLLPFPSSLDWSPFRFFENFNSQKGKMEKWENLH